jgi:hypothetical protein
VLWKGEEYKAKMRIAEGLWLKFGFNPVLLLPAQLALPSVQRTMGI